MAKRVLVVSSLLSALVILALYGCGATTAAPTTTPLPTSTAAPAPLPTTAPTDTAAVAQPTATTSGDTPTTVQDTPTVEANMTAGLPTPTPVVVDLPANSGHETPDKALALTLPENLNIQLGSSSDVVYLKFTLPGPGTESDWVYDPTENGPVQVRLLDSSQKELNLQDLKPGDQDSSSQVLNDAGTYFFKVSNSGSKETTNPIQLQIDPIAANQ